MTKSELRQLILTRFNQSELDSLMFDFCDLHPEVKYFGYVHGNFESQISQLLLSLSDVLILKLEQFIMAQRPDIANSPPIVLTMVELREAITKRYHEQELENKLFEFHSQFDWGMDIPQHLAYSNKVQELLKFCNRRGLLPQLAKHLGL